MAAAYFGLRHTRLESLMVSNPQYPEGEGWDLALQGEWTDPCNSKLPTRDKDFKKALTSRLPTTVHYCQGLPFEECGEKTCSSFMDQYPRWHKKHVATNTLTCTAPLPKLPPRNLIELAHTPSLNPNKRSQSEHHRDMTYAGVNAAWSVCAITGIIDEALIAWKEKFCNAGYNAERTADIHRPSASASDPHGAPSAAKNSLEGLKAEYAKQDTTLQALKAEQAAMAA
jgi:hypothetical protein